MNKKLIKTIFCTGGSGFVGKRLVAELLSVGYNVVNYDIVEGKDIRDIYKLNRSIAESNPDVVIHMAARAGVGDGILYPDEYISTNIKGTLNVIDACQRNAIKKIIFFSSSSVFGGNKRDGGLIEEDALTPISLYGITKVAGETLIKNSGLQYAIIRPFSIYGENGRSDSVVYKWIKTIKDEGTIRINGNGDSYRGYTYIGDLCNSVIKIINLLYKNQLKNYVFNLGGEEIITIATLSSIFQKFCSEHDIDLNVEYLPLQSWDIKESFANTSLAKELINFNSSNEYEKVINSILKKELI